MKKIKSLWNSLMYKLMFKNYEEEEKEIMAAPLKKDIIAAKKSRKAYEEAKAKKHPKASQSTKKKK
jgi:hypothetical protein|tara:strand:+ start:414 stop:611 length:198 start_codon:yes stop_codon:yes gene_type:complete